MEWSDIIEFLEYPLLGDPKKPEQFHVTPLAIIFAILGILATTVILKLFKRFFTRKMSQVDRLKFESIFKYFNYIVYIIVVAVILNSSGLKITAFLTAGAALFVGLGFALQDLFKDIIAGITILIDKSVLVSDIIEMNDKVGRVIEIKLRSTRVITRDDKILVIPNHLFLSESVYNYTQNHPKTRESVFVGVAYGSDVRLVEKLLVQAAKEQNGVMEKPEPFVMFNDFGDSSLDFGLYFYVRDSFTDPRLKSDIRFNIDQLFRDNNVTIPFPQRDVHLFNQNNSQE
jgi:small-conductance mechanosensitive channel